MNPEELEKIVKSNQLALARIEKQVEKISKKMLWNRLAGILKIILIVGPIIVGVLYLSPLLKEYSGSIGTLLNGFKIYTGGGLENIDLNNSNTVDSQKAGVNVNDLLRDFCKPELREIYVKNLCK